MSTIPKTQAGCRRFSTPKLRKQCVSWVKAKKLLSKKTKGALGGTSFEHNEHAHLLFGKARKAAGRAHKFAIAGNCAKAVQAGAAASQLVGQAYAEDLHGSKKKPLRRQIVSLGWTVERAMQKACATPPKRVGPGLLGVSKRRRRR